jgi:hypothetical protein
VRRLLLVTPHWIPVNAPDLQRVRTSLPHYRAFGWDPVVLGVDADGVDAVREPELAATVPADVPVHRCGALSRRWTRSLGLGSLGWRCLPSLWRMGRQLIRDERIDLVFMSTTQFTTIAAARAWKAEFGVPYVVDVQDPWRTDAYERPGAPPPPGGAKYRFARVVAAALEGPLFRGAAGFVSVSDGYLADLKRRYPGWMPDRPAETIPFGVNADDFRLAGVSVPPVEAPRPGKVSIVYTGAAGPILGEALDRIFAAVAAVRRTDPAGAARLHLQFIGTRYSTAAGGAPLILPRAERHGIADLVEERSRRIGHLESLRRQSEADLLLLPGADDPDYSPSKLPLYLLAGPPVLAVVPEGGTLHRTLASVGLPSLIVFPRGADSERVQTEIVAGLRRALDDRRPTAPAIDRAAVLARWGAGPLTARQCAVFDRAWRRHHRQPDA